MKSYYFISALVAALACIPSSYASSAPQRPLKRISHPSPIALDILPRRPSNPAPAWNPLRRSISDDSPLLRHTDAIRLSIRAFDQDLHLHLRPNSALFHPSARINHYSSDGVITRTEPLLASDYRVYEGSVVSPARTRKRWLEDAAGGIADEEREMGWARIIVHDQGDALSGRAPQYEGAFTVHGVTHHVQTRTNYLRNRHARDPLVEQDGDDVLVIFRDTDVTPVNREGAPGHSCSHDSLEHNSKRELNNVLSYAADLSAEEKRASPWYDPRRAHADPIDLDARLAPVKRQGNDISGGNVTTNFIDRIGSHVGCKATQSFIYMGVAADCTYVTAYSGIASATTQIINDWNSVSALYKSTFNISMGIVELAVQEPTCPTTANASVPWNVGCTDSVTLNDRLSLFSAWRGKKGGDGAGLWHLMSGCPTGTEVGVAWLGQLCNVQASGQVGEVVSGTGVSTNTRTEWQVIAHEVGHNFGAIHDCAPGCTLKDSCCPDSTTACSSDAVYIMDAVSNVGENTFSPCSVGNICAAMDTMNTTCLLPANSAVQVISLQMCGNGIVEQGEDCDPGKGNVSPCCDSTTCKFVANAKCDPKSSDCCTNACQFSPSTQVCRPAVDPTCDVAESCTGTSAACPEDVTTADGTSCGGSGLACASGKCTSLDLQCQTVGASLGLSKACPANTNKDCQVACQDPSNSQQCIVLQSTWVDGSPCGYGGKCFANSCKSGSVLDTIKAWYRQNLQISIPVTIVAGVVIILILWRIFTSCVTCCRRRKTAAYKSGGTQGRQRLQSWQQPPPQHPSQYGGGVGYPPMRDAPQTSSRGYTSPGMSYPPAHVDNQPADNNNDAYYGGGPNPIIQNPNPFQDDRAGRGMSPTRQASTGWVDDRQYNGAGYGGGR